jgi:DNA-binding NtrC family response regulator
MRTGRADEAVTLAIDSLPHIVSIADRSLLQRMQLLAAEGLARTGRAAEGAALLAEAAIASPEPALEMIAECARVAGHVAAPDSPAVAAAHFERATRVHSTLGNITARGEVIMNAAEAFAVAQGPGPPALWHELPALYRMPRRVYVRFDTSVPLLADPRSPAAAAIETAGAIMDLAAHAPLFGHEVLALIARAQAADAAALVASTNGHRDVIASSGCDAHEACRLETSALAVRIDLGLHADRHHQVVARPAAAPSARMTLLAIQRLAAASRALHAARQREREQAALWPEQSAEQQLGMVFAAESMVELVKTTRRLATANITVLIMGETGTGKELLARALHEGSPRRDHPFVPFNCTAVAKDMLDAQLFGYRRGSFTGAQEAFNGVIRAAAGGTLFLDEIGEIGLDVQPKLLRFLESGEIHPLGEPRPLPVDVRIVAATNANLDHLVSEGRFREDLYYRLNVVRLQVPPLRERREEIPLLVEHFLEKYSQDARKMGIRVAEETMEYLVLYRWPGNVRQLANELRRMVALAEPGAILMPEHLSREIAASRRTIPASERDLTPREVVVRLDQPLPAATEHVERTIIQYALTTSGGRLDDAARALGLSRKGLYLKRQRLGLD